MKSFLNRIGLCLMVTSLATVSVFAKTKIETVNFPTSIKINGTLVNKGVYRLKYDEKAGELTIVKGNKVIARATTSVEKRDRKARDFELKSTGTGEETQLIGIAFAGADHNVVISGSQASR